MGDSQIIEAFQKGEREDLDRWLQSRMPQATTAPRPPRPPTPPVPGEPVIRAQGVADAANPANMAGHLGYDPLFLNRIREYGGNLIGSVLDALGPLRGLRSITPGAVVDGAANAISAATGLLVSPETVKSFVENVGGNITDRSVGQFLGTVLFDPTSYAAGMPGGMKFIGAAERNLAAGSVEAAATGRAALPARDFLALPGKTVADSPRALPAPRVGERYTGAGPKALPPGPTGPRGEFIMQPSPLDTQTAERVFAAPRTPETQTVRSAIEAQVRAESEAAYAQVKANEATLADTASARDLAAQRVVESAGGRYRGTSDMAGETLVWFDEPQSGSTNLVKLSELTPEKVSQSLEKTRAAYAEAARYVDQSGEDFSRFLASNRPLPEKTVAATAMDWQLPMAQTETALEAGRAVAKSLEDTDLQAAKSATAFALVKDGMKSEAGAIDRGLLFALGRAAVGAVAGGATGDDPETAARNALLGAGLGAVMSSRLATKIVEYAKSPAAHDTLREAFTSEAGAWRTRTPSWASKVQDASPNVAYMGTTDAAKRIVLGINERLQAAKTLARAHTISHDETIAAAATSKFRNLEDVLSLDTAAIKPADLASTRTAARGVRDLTLEDYLETAARAKLTGDPNLMAEARQKFLVAGKVSQRVTDLETEIARGQQAGQIMSTSEFATKYDLNQLSRDVTEMDADLLRTVSDEQLIDMTTAMADRAQVNKIAQTASKYPEALWEIYYGLNLLSSPVTQMRNIVGNFGGVMMGVTDRAFGEIAALPFREPGKAGHVAPGEAYELIRGLWESVADAMRAGKKTFLTGESQFYGAGKSTERLQMLASRTVDPSQEGSLFAKTIDTMATLARGNLRFMEGVDEFFKVIQFHAELRALARRQAYSEDIADVVARNTRINDLIDNPTRDMLKGAHAWAVEQTYTKEFSPETLGGKLKAFASTPAARLTITPFFRTPMRIAEYSMVHTPILNLAAQQFRSDLAQGGAKAELAFAKLATGASMIGLVGWYAAHGYITGNGPKDAGLRNRMIEAGWQPKSVYVPTVNKYVTYDNLEPVSSIIATTADFFQMAPELPDHQVQTVLSALVIAATKNAVAKQYFQSISDLSDVIESASEHDTVVNGIRFASKRLAALVPGSAILRSTANALDDIRRESKSVVGDDPETREVAILMNEIKREIPGWSATRPAKLNMVTGEPIMYEGGNFPGSPLISPFLVTTNNNDPVLNEIIALGGAGLPREIPRVIGGAPPSGGVRLMPVSPKEGVMLSDEERVRFTRIATKEVKDYNGDTLYRALGRLMRSDEYKDQSDGPDGGKALAVRSVFNSFLHEAEQQLYEDYPALVTVVRKRQLERGLGRLPKSLEDMKPGLRQLAQ